VVVPACSPTYGYGNAMSERHWYLISYDIREDKRRTAAAKLILGYGERIQYSLFKAQMTRCAMSELQWELEVVMDGGDDLLIVHLCPSCARRVEDRQSQAGWGSDSRGFDVF